MKRYRREDENSYALGITLTFELLKFAPKQARKIYIHSKMQEGESLDRLKELAGSLRVPVEYGDKPFNILSQKENCFCIGEFEKFNRPLSKDASHVVLHNPSNAGNLGTIMRSATGFGIKDLAIIRPSVDEFDVKTVRASMGAVFHLNIQLFDTFDDYLKEFGNRNLYPFMLKGRKNLSELEFEKPYSLIFGNEATGLPDSFLNIGTGVVISHSDNIDSLNLPIAASIALYAATRKDFGKGD